jgi:uncharacterized HAD superfamily protein/adenine/guanine phosphoribosyltransferase-like PRPP-binding protein
MLRQMQYRSLADLNRDVLRLLTRLPRDIDLVVGVPRSGLLVANLFALYLNVPLADAEGFMAGRTLASGRRRAPADSPADSPANSASDSPANSASDSPDTRAGTTPRRRSVLVVDDSISSGKQLRAVRERIEAAMPTATITYLAVYATAAGASQVDVVGEIIEKPRCFEWNVLHHDQLDTFCVDIDGVLCLDPTKDENDDGERYERFLQDAIPYFLPTKKVGWLVTCRLERYRQHTEQWLQRHGVEYGELVMMQHPDGQARKLAGNHAEYKAEVYRRTGAAFFIESSARQATRIAALTGKPVLCLETGTLASPDEVAAAKRVVRDLPRALPSMLLRRARRGLSALARRIPLGEQAASLQRPAAASMSSALQNGRITGA